MRSLRVLAVTALLGAVTAVPAHATAYAYWSYWQADGSQWRYANVGPAVSPAVDGAVDGWRFTVASQGQAERPTTAPDFEQACGSVARPAGMVRVAVVIDPGPDGPPPTVTCAVVAEGLSRASALARVAALRTDSGFICAINGYPARGCGDVVADPTPAASAATSAAPKTTRTAVSTASAAASPTATAATPTAAATAEPVAPTPEASATTSPTTTSTASATPDASAATTDGEDSGSPLPTIVTIVLGAVALALALRNARLQREGR